MLDVYRNYIKLNPFLFAVAIMQLLAAILYMVQDASPTRLKLGAITFFYSICNFIFISIK